MSFDPTVNEVSLSPAPVVSEVAPASTSEPSQPEASPPDVSTEPAAQSDAQPAATTEQTAQLLQALKMAGESVEKRLTDEEVKMAAVGVTPPSKQHRAVAIPDAPDLGDLEAQINAAMEADTKQTTLPPGVPVKSDMPELNSRATGTVQSIHAGDVFLDLGFRLPGVLQLRMFEGTEPPVVGAQLQVVVRKIDENEGLIAVNLPRGKQRLGGNWDAVEVGQVVDCTVTKTNKGGLEVNVGSLRGFMPAGQVDMSFVENLEVFVGQKLQVKITEANRHKKNLIVSRKALLQEEREESEGEFWAKLVKDQEYSGTVKTIKDYGAFIDLGGADGFLHIGQVSWNHIRHPGEVLKVGQSVNVKVLEVDPEKKRISLGMKQLMQNPWFTAAEKYVPESTVKGKVTRIAEFGAFVELEPSIEGMIHISELDHKRVRRVTDVVNIGDEVEAKVLEFDATKKRVSLSLKALKAAPASEVKPEEPDAPPVIAKKKREELRGGTGGGLGGGMFGNPNDFT